MANDLPRLEASGSSFHSLVGKAELGWVMGGAVLGNGAQLHFLSPNKGFFRNSQPHGNHSL